MHHRTKIAVVKHKIKVDTTFIRDVFCKQFRIPANATHLKVYVKVPGGGDWSNTDLELDDSNSLYVSWIVQEVSNG